MDLDSVVISKDDIGIYNFIFPDAAVSSLLYFSVNDMKNKMFSIHFTSFYKFQSKIEPQNPQTKPPILNPLSLSLSYQNKLTKKHKIILYKKHIVHHPSNK